MVWAELGAAFPGRWRVVFDSLSESMEPKTWDGGCHFSSLLWQLSSAAPCRLRRAAIGFSN